MAGGTREPAAGTGNLFCKPDIPLDAIQALLCYVAYSCVG